MAELLTLKEIAQRLNIPPATVKYYRDQFSEYMPAVNIGRYPKYSIEALQLIEDIRRLFKEGYNSDQVKAELIKNHAINQEANLAATTTATTAQQEEKALYLLDKQADLLQEQQATIASQAALIERLNGQLAREQSVKERLLLHELTRNKKKTKPKKEKQRPWYKKLF